MLAAYCAAKAGVAASMAVVSWLRRHPESQHGGIRVAFTPDEEVGRGTEHFDVAAFGADEPDRRGVPGAGPRDDARPRHRIALDHPRTTLAPRLASLVTKSS